MRAFFTADSVFRTLSAGGDIGFAWRKIHHITVGVETAFHRFHRRQSWRPLEIVYAYDLTVAPQNTRSTHTTASDLVR